MLCILKYLCFLRGIELIPSCEVRALAIEPKESKGS